MKKVLAISVALLAAPAYSLSSKPGPSKVSVEHGATGWELTVNGHPFYIKGVACNDGLVDGVDYLKMVAETGANAVRVYGDVTDEYLNLAQRYGLMVNVGFWTDAVRSHSTISYRDNAYTRSQREAALAYVRRFKNHPSVLSWTLGNETFIFSEPEQEREAYGAFLADLVKAVHKEDPYHPIVYSSSYTRDLPYLKRFVPDIDIVGVNVTGGAGPAVAWVERNGFDKPVIVSEFAPLGAWEMRKDPNNMPYDPFDHMKADLYRSSWRQMQANPKSCIGGFAFVLGAFRNQDSLTWYNMNYGELKRSGFWTVRELYTGEKPVNAPPKISAFSVSPIEHLAAGSRTHVHTEVMKMTDSPLTYDYMVTNIANDPLIVEKPIFFPTDPKSSTPGDADVKVPEKPGTYRIYVGVKDNHGNIAIANRTIHVE